MLLRRCVFCLASGAAEVRFDKRSRPYVVCRLCGTRAFVRNLEALYGLAIAPELLESAISRRDREPEYKKWFDGEISKLVADVRGARPTQTPAGLPEVPVVPFESDRKAS